MPETFVVEAGDCTVRELLDAINGGTHVIVQTEFLGAEHEVTLRHDGNTYYCDTPTRLHKHETEAEMRQCLKNQGYGTDGTA